MATRTKAKKESVKKDPAKKAAKVPAKSDAATDLRELFEEQLKDIYWAEKALTKALPKMAKNATNGDLKEAITGHLKETEVHVQRLEKVFKLLGKKAQAKKCDAMAGILKEGSGILEETRPGAVRDAGIIGASQKVEHYEMATYGTLQAYARLLGKNEAAGLLNLTLEEEKTCDAKLSKLAETVINFDANAA